MKKIQPEIKKESEWKKKWCHVVDECHCVGDKCTAWITVRVSKDGEKYGVCGDLLR